jgi:Uma2 family endonuclease
MTPATLEAPVIVNVPPVIDDGDRYEIIDGNRVELPPMSAFASRIAFWIVFEINAFARANNLGEAITETLFRLPLPRSRNRRPDGAFISYQRWPKGRPQPVRDNAWDVVPDLAIEVVSPTDIAEDLLTKIDEYLRAGVSLVWVVFPSLRVIHIYESMTQIRVATATGELDGGGVLPGFRVAVAALFPEAAADEGAPQ